MIQQPTRPLSPSEKSERSFVMAVYVLYILGAITGVFGPIIGLIIALVQKRKAQTELGRSHFKKQVQMVFYALGGTILGLLLVFLTILLIDYKYLDKSYDFIAFIGLGFAAITIIWFFCVSAMSLFKAVNADNA